MAIQNSPDILLLLAAFAVRPPFTKFYTDPNRENVYRVEGMF